MFSYFVIFFVGLLFSLFLSRELKNSKIYNKNLLLVFFATFIILYGCFILLLTMSNYNRMVSQSIDVQHYHTQIWQLSEFKVPAYNWSQHFEPILLFIVPLYWLIKAAGILMFLQAINFISTVVPIYLIVKKHIHSGVIGISLAFAYLAFGGTQFGIAYGFHPIMLFPTIFIWMYYFYLEKKFKFYFLFVLLSLMVKEEVVFVMFFWALYVLLARKQKRVGVLTMIASVFWYILCFHIIFPAFNPGKGYIYWGQYNQANGTGLVGITMFALMHPLEFFRTLITPTYKIDTFFQSFGAFGFIAFFYPPSLLLVIPSLFQKLLSSGIAAVNGTHYNAALAGVTLVATIESLRRVLGQKRAFQFVGNRYIFLGTLLFYHAFFYNILFGYYVFTLAPSGGRTGYPVNNVVIEPSDSSLRLLSSVAAQYQIIPHLHKSPTLLFDIPRANEDADYVLVDTQLPPPVLTDTRLLNSYLEGLDNNKNYKLIINQQGIVLFQKVDTIYKF
jgi:uncharacterized membrane protein